MAKPLIIALNILCIRESSPFFEALSLNGKNKGLS